MTIGRNLFNLSGKTALITGGSRGLGLQIAEALGDYGARLVISSRKAADLEQARDHLRGRGAEVDFVAADIADDQDVRRLAADTMGILAALTFWSTTPVRPGRRLQKITRSMRGIGS